METQDFRYWAFISYSSADSALCKKLHKALENYKIPAALVGNDSRGEATPAKIFPVFRDRDELPLNANLGASIQDALRLSRYLIVLCSKKAAQSQWVNEEIRYFKSLGREDRVLAIIVDGEPNASDDPTNQAEECFPPALRYELNEDGQLSERRAEPIAGDLRASGDGWNKAFLKCVAGILGIGLDEIIQRDKVAKTKRQRVQGISTLFGLALFSVLIWGYFSANQTAVVSQQISENLKNSILCTNVETSDIAHAVVVGDIAAAEKALANGADINEQNCEQKTTLLHKAILAGHVFMVDWLLDKGADPTIDDFHGYSAVLYPALTGREAILDIFVKHGIDLNTPEVIQNQVQSTIMDTAIKMGKIEVVKKLLQLGVPVVTENVHRSMFSSALATAAAYNQPEIVKLLLSNGADPRFTESGTKTTPIKLAQNSGAMEVVGLFEQYEADHAINQNQEELNASLLRILGGWQPEKITMDQVEHLLTQGADPFAAVQSEANYNSIEKSIDLINMFCFGKNTHDDDLCSRFKQILTRFVSKGIDQQWLQNKRDVLTIRLSHSGSELKRILFDAGFKEAYGMGLSDILVVPKMSGNNIELNLSSAKTRLSDDNIQVKVGDGEWRSAREKRFVLNGIQTVTLRKLDEDGDVLEQRELTSEIVQKLTQDFEQQAHRVIQDNRNWHCALGGCAIKETVKKTIICNPLVKEASIRQEGMSGSVKVDLSQCTVEQEKEHFICMGFSQFPDPIKPFVPYELSITLVTNESILLKIPFNMRDFKRVLRNANGEDPRQWVELQAIDSLNPEGNAPPLVVAFEPSGTLVGNLRAVSGLNSCEMSNDLSTWNNFEFIPTSGWLVDTDGKGLLRPKRGRSYLDIGPNFDNYINEKDKPSFEYLLSGDNSVGVAAEPSPGSRIGPYYYRIDGASVIQRAADLADLPEVECKPTRLKKPYVCSPRQKLNWIGVKKIVFGSSPDDMQQVFEIDYSVHDFTLSDCRSANDKTCKPFKFSPPPEWTDIYYVITDEDGIVLPIERVPVK